MAAAEAPGATSQDAMTPSMEISRGLESLLHLYSIAGIIENVLYTTLLCFGEAKSHVTVT